MGSLRVKYLKNKHKKKINVRYFDFKYLNTIMFINYSSIFSYIHFSLKKYFLKLNSN